ncbi:MAG: methionine--tRNA ligase [Alphaproteobacteria bacterium]|nr:MAG: methionine--tRNA ligase [Alphaproteobacteria bacterium]
MPPENTALNTASTFYITTPIFYVNGAPHLGHAYTSIAADTLARWKRLDGIDVLFVTGTDEHGQKVEQAARDAGIEPQAFVDGVSAKFRALGPVLNLSNDVFIRTTEARHARACQEIWRRLRDNGDIYLGYYEGWYALRDEAFYNEEELTTATDGTRFAPSGAPVEWMREPSYFFRLSNWGDRLLEFYDAIPDRILPPGRRNEVISFVRGGLKDLAVSRSGFAWGVPVPDDTDHVMYVWLDALINYLTACGFPDDADPLWRFWPADIHVVGKDIIRFHAVIWPAVCMAAGLPAPQRIVAHGWWTARGEKMSKSLGNAIDGIALVETYGIDAVRFFVLREIPFGNDGDFSDAALIRRLNAELANDLGNLSQRTLSQIAKNLGGVLPAASAPTDADSALLDPVRALPATLRPMMDRMALGDALEEIWKTIRAANAYVDHQAPWALRKTDPARMAAVLRVLVDTLRVIATVLTPFMPDSMGRMLDQLGVPAKNRNLASLDIAIPEEVVLPAPQGIFPRYVETEA